MLGVGGQGGHGIVMELTAGSCGKIGPFALAEFQGKQISLLPPFWPSLLAAHVSRRSPLSPKQSPSGTMHSPHVACLRYLSVVPPKQAVIPWCCARGGGKGQATQACDLHTWLDALRLSS